MTENQNENRESRMDDDASNLIGNDDADLDYEIIEHDSKRTSSRIQKRKNTSQSDSKKRKQSTQSEQKKRAPKSKSKKQDDEEPQINAPTISQ